MLQSAVQAPINFQYYEGENDALKLAAVLASRVVKNHAFGNGNKRTGLLAVCGSLGRGGGGGVWGLERGSGAGDVKRKIDNDDLVRAFDEVAMGKMEEGDLARVLRRVWRVGDPTAGVGGDVEGGRG